MTEMLHHLWLISYKPHPNIPTRNLTKSPITVPFHTGLFAWILFNSLSLYHHSSVLMHKVKKHSVHLTQSFQPSLVLYSKMQWADLEIAWHAKLAKCHDCCCISYKLGLIRSYYSVLLSEDCSGKRIWIAD